MPSTPSTPLICHPAFAKPTAPDTVTADVLEPQSASPGSDSHQHLSQYPAQFRSDLTISRQANSREGAMYVIHDPVSFQTHRLDFTQYYIASQLVGDTLEETFQKLKNEGALSDGDETSFYELVTNLYRVGLVVLPIQRGEKFLEQYEHHQKIKRSKRLLSLLFLKIPLAHPDLFLKHTLSSFNFLFSRWFAVVWVLAGLMAFSVIAIRFDEFIEPLNGVLAPRNLPILWMIFVALKVWHELGHGYACKRFGGRVPEMGTILVVGNPLAYVDATSAWSFPERWKRLTVLCGGMYFETLIAIPAVFVWALAGNGATASIAYQVILTASVVTLVFNANPLMKFDGYYILSELIKIPNLRGRADAQVRRLLKRTLLWISSGPNETRQTCAFLIAYGFASATYRFFLVLSIAWIIASQFPLLGILIAAYYVISSFLSSSFKIGRYLLASPETLLIPIRSRLVAALVFLGLPLAGLLVPVPFDVITVGVVRSETEHHVRVKSPGQFNLAHVSPGDAIEPGQPVIALENARVTDRLEIATEKLTEARLKWRVAREHDLVEAAQIKAEIFSLEHQRSDARQMQSDLQLSSPIHGNIQQVYGSERCGEFLRTGATVAVIGDGPPVIHVWLTQEQLREVSTDNPAVAFRLEGCSEQTYAAKLVRIKPAAESIFTEEALTNLAGGDLLVDAETGQPVDTLFQLELSPESRALPLLEQRGRRVAIAWPRAYESMGSWGLRKCFRLLQELLQA